MKKNIFTNSWNKAFITHFIGAVILILFIQNSCIGQINDSIKIAQDTVNHDTFNEHQTIRDTINQDSTLLYQDSLQVDSIKTQTLLLNDSTTTSSDIKPKSNIKRAQYIFKDSTDVYYITDIRLVTKQYTDTILNISSTEEDRGRDRSNNYFHTGNIGSSAIPIRYQLSTNINKDIGFHQYDLYNENIDSVKHYLVQKPFSKAYFLTSTNKDNFSTGIQYANHYDHDIYLNIDFKRINQVGLYNNHKTKHSDFKSSIFWNNNRHQLFLTFNNRTNEESNNGGVRANTDFKAIINQIRTNISTNLDKTNTRHYQTGVNVTNKYLLLKVKNNNLELFHQLKYQHNTYKFSDLDILKNKLYYKNLFTDSRGIRFYLDHNIWKNNIGVSIYNKKYFSTIAYLSYQNHGINNDFLKINDNILDLNVEASFKIKKWLNKGSLQFNIFGLENNSNLQLNSTIDFGEKWGGITFSYQNLRKSASFVQQHLILNNLTIWETNFDIQTSNSLAFSYSNKYTNTKLSYKVLQLHDHIYYDDSMKLKQSNKTLIIQQISARQDFKLWQIHSSHEILLQDIPNKVFALPKLYTKHDLYWQYPFKSSNKTLRIGANIRYYISDYLLQDQAALGLFYPSKTPFDDYWTTDVYVSMKIERLRFYINYSNVDQLFDRKIDYQILNHPQFDNIVKFGVNVILYD